MITEYVVSTSDVGTVFQERNGFLLSLVQSRPPSGDCYARRWEERCFTLKDEMSPQCLFHLDVTTSRPPPLCIGGAYFWANNAAIPFFGALTLVACPFGSEWEIVLSNVYVQPRKSLYTHWGSGFAPNGQWGSNWAPRALPPRTALPLLITGSVAEPIIHPTERR